MSKPKVTYGEVIVPPQIGFRAVVRISSPHHTLSEQALEFYDRIVTTSTVKDVFEEGGFETLNTHYVPDERA